MVCLKKLSKSKKIFWKKFLSKKIVSVRKNRQSEKIVLNPKKIVYVQKNDLNSKK